MSQIIATLNGDDLNVQQLELRNKAVSELCKFAATNGCQGCSRSARNEWIAKIHQLPYDKLLARFQQTFGWPCVIE